MNGPVSSKPRSCGGGAYVSRHKDTEGASLGKKAVLVDRDDHSINLDSQQDRTKGRTGEWVHPYRLSLEGSPDHGAIANREFCKPTAG